MHLHLPGGVKLKHKLIFKFEFAQSWYLIFATIQYKVMGSQWLDKLSIYKSSEMNDKLKRYSTN